MYLFFDGLQRIDAWEDAVNSFRVDLDCDIYVTGSNVSSGYSTYLSCSLRTTLAAASPSHPSAIR